MRARNPAASTSRVNRPLSPHLQVYRLPLTALLSISHRITGVFLCGGLLLLTLLLFLAAIGPEVYESARLWLASLPGRVLLWGFIYALVFHACHGVRHLIWDSGRGFARGAQFRFNLLEVLASILLTGLLFILNAAGAV
ncbi:MAG: succinate dehydrogenase, cytochrome b556 subunit [Methylococcaceae bacterium]|jgi:succinate dehydrogenase / fumarate reductase cytochrome b subunit